MTRGGMPACPAMGLFEKREVQDVATENIMRVGRDLITSADRRTVSTIVAVVFKNVSLELQKQSPRLASELEMIQLNDSQMAAVLAALELLSHREVQRIGLNVARAIRGGADDAVNQASAQAMRDRIEGRLHPMIGDINKVRNTLIPKVMQEFWSAEHQWGMTLDIENLRLMAEDSKDLSDFTPLTSVRLEAMSIGIEDGVLEQARALIDLIKLSAHLFGKEVHVPARVTSLAARRPKRRPMYCELANVEINKVDILKAWFCPLKFGSQGVDALRAVAHMKGGKPKELF